MKRFYSDAAVVPADEGYAVVLDGRPVKTPGQRPVAAPTAALAEAVAEEWQAQGETLDPAAMPLARSLNSAIDTSDQQRAAVVTSLSRYAETDLLCYRAAGQPALAERQRYLWQPYLDWAAERFAARFALAEGVMPVVQPRATVDALAVAVAGFDRFRLTGVHLAAGVTGSVVLALALEARFASAEQVWTAASLDEAFQAELWGEDSAAAERRAAIAAEVRAADRFLSLLDAG
ncbi:hypothetical protein CCR85_13910 [Rhodothalassium salexigens]|uniref:ATP12 family protein n=1 Tax=Rhodothalassium salexigens TaxID=1086 RepID=UPI001911BE12|nr:hypothetical protein [Rhodothalassium salexigens]MBK5919639.1 hypothetical protein [Rhodothalassium salexigens]